MTADTDPDDGPDATFATEVREHGSVQRIIQIRDGDYIEAGATAPTPAPRQEVRGCVGVPDRHQRLVGRADELDRLDRAGDRVVVVGTGGVGKSALVAALARRAYESETVGLVRWLTGERRPLLVEQYLAFGTAVGAPVEGLDEREALGVVSRRLETVDVPWLLVIDNVEDPTVLAGLIPTAGNGRVVVTSRTRGPAWRQRGFETFDLEVLDPDDAVRLLASSAGRDPDDLDPGEAARLVDNLGRLALAVVQAGAYLATTSRSVSEYRSLLARNRQRLLAANPAGLATGDGRQVTVWSVWDTSIRRAAEQSPLAPALLEVAAYLGPDQLPVTVLEQATAHLGGRDGDREEDLVAFDQALAALVSLSLVDPGQVDLDDDSRARVMSTHRLIQQVTRDTTNDPAGRCAAAVRALGAVLPPDPTTPDTWGLHELLAPHVLAVADHAETDDVELAGVSWLLDRHATWLQYSGSLLLAIAPFQRALDLAVQLHGHDHTTVLTRQHNLALAVRSAGRTDDAIELLEHVAARRVELLGADDPGTLITQSQLAIAYRSAGRTDDAIELQEHVAAQSVELLGADHPDTLSAQNNLAIAYRSAGRTDDADELLEHVAARRVELLGADHPDTLTAQNNLAGSYWSAGRTDDAIGLLEHVAARRVELLGADHPDTLTAQNNLAGSYWSAGRTDDAIGLLEHVAARRVELLGADHPDTLTAQGNLAIAYRSAGRTDDAIDLLEHVAARRVEVLGVDHPDTAAAVAALARLRVEAYAV